MEFLATPSAGGSGSKVRVYIVDSYPLIRRGLVELIDGAKDLTVCGEAGDSGAAFNAIVEIRPDVVIVEIALQGNSGIELIRSINDLDSRIGILVVSMQDESIHAPQALRAGARGFVSKSAESTDVLDAVRRINRGKFCFSAEVETDLLSQIVNGSEPGADPSVRALSRRELEVGWLIGQAATTRDIATRLRVSIKTVETYRAHLKEKLGLRNSARLAQFWVNWIGSGRSAPGLAAAAPQADSAWTAARTRPSPDAGAGAADHMDAAAPRMTATDASADRSPDGALAPRNNGHTPPDRKGAPSS